MAPDPDQPYVGRNAFAHKAGMHAAGVAADASTFEHLDPALVGNDREILASELSGKATIRTQAEQAGLELDDEAAARAVERLKEREHRGYHYEAAPASFELLLRQEAGSYEPLFKLESFRVTTEKRADGEVETEATIKVEVDGERYVRTAEGNGPVNALDRALRAAIVDGHPHLADIELTNYKVRILDETHGTDAVTRVLLDSSDGEREWGTIGVSENIIEASWEALVDSLEYAFQPRAMSDRAPTTSRSRWRRPELGEREEELVLEVLRSGRLSLGPMGERFERAFAEWLGVEDAVAVSSGTAALHLGVRALGWGEGDEVADQPVQLRRLRQLPALRGRPAGLLRRRPGDARPRPGGRRGGARRAHRRASCRSTSSATRRRWPSSRRSPPPTASASSRTPARRSARSTATGARVGARGNLATFAFYANKQMTTGEGGMVDPVLARGRGAPALRAQPGPRRRHGLARPRRARLQLPARRPRRGARRRPGREARRAARAARGASPPPTPSAWPAIEGVEAPIAGRGAERRSWFVYPVRLAAGVDRDATIARLAERGIASKAYLPCIHLFPHLRELGYREGQFPVAEEASARSLALPFFPSMTEAQVDRVCEALAESLT